MTLEEREALARQIASIAKAAGHLMLEESISAVTQKGDAANIVTDVDVKCQRFIIEECQKCLPEGVFLAEEEGRQQVGDGFTWVVDPIDGTTNYMYDYRHSCVSIALYEQRQGLIGVIYDPYLDECFIGLEGCGSFLNGKPIHVSAHPFEEALVMVGTSPYEKASADTTFRVMKNLFLTARDIRRSGSAALDLCYLACGRVDAFYEHSLQPWDYGAGCIIVRNARGVIEPLTDGAFDALMPTGVLCSNGVCHGALRDTALGQGPQTE